MTYRPLEAAVILLPIHDFLHLNTVFNAVLLEPLISDTQSSASSDLPPLILTLLTLSSYILTHASSVQNSRATAYASLCLVTLLHLAENDVAMSALLQVQKQGNGVRLCRQVMRAFLSRYWKFIDISVTSARAYTTISDSFETTLMCCFRLLCSVVEA